MSSFCILVNHPPFDQQHSYSALRFAQAVLARGHQLTGVFFYQSGALNGNHFAANFSDELNLHKQWCELHDKHGVPLQVCITAANRRGVIDANDADELDSPHFNLKAPFDSAGLGELVGLMNNSDRTVQF